MGALMFSFVGPITRSACSRVLRRSIIEIGSHARRSTMSFWSNLFGGGGSRKAATARRPQQRPSGQRPPASAGHTPATRTCTDCGATFPQSTTFCPRCGKTFGSSKPAPTKPGESITKAVQLYNEGKVEEALAEAKRLIELNPKHATAHGSLGYFLLEQRRFDEAVNPMLRSLELNPNSK